MTLKIAARDRVHQVITAVICIVETSLEEVHLGNKILQVKHLFILSKGLH